MILPIRTLGDPVLRAPANPVAEFDRKLRARCATTWSRRCTPRPAWGSPPRRWASPLRLFVFDDGETGPLLHGEPRAVRRRRRADGGRRLPVDPGPVPPDAALRERSRAAARTSTARPFEMTGEGLLARIFQHETDHLDGMLFIDRLDDEGRRSVMAELRRLELGLQEPQKRRLLRRVRWLTCVRVLFLGNDAWSVPTLEALADAPTSTSRAAITNPPRPAGRGSQLAADRRSPRRPGDSASRSLEAEGVRTGRGARRIDGSQPDAIVVVAYGELLPPEVLDVPRLGSAEPALLAAAAVARSGPRAAGDPGGRRGHRRQRDAARRGARHRPGARPARGADRRRRRGRAGGAARRARRADSWSRRSARLARGTARSAAAGRRRRDVRGRSSRPRIADRLASARPTRSCGGSAPSRPRPARPPRFRGGPAEGAAGRGAGRVGGAVLDAEAGGRARSHVGPRRGAGRSRPRQGAPCALLEVAPAGRGAHVRRRLGPRRPAANRGSGCG